MAKTASNQPVEETIQTEPVPVEVPALVTAQEFCADKSGSDKRVELIGGFFYFLSKIKKVHKATRADFEKYFQEFLARPA